MRASLAGALIPHGSVLVDCELLLHFDESNPNSWKDFSTKQHPISLHTFSGGSIAQNPSGEFGGCLALTQYAPGSGGEPDYDTQTYVVASGSVAFDSGEFYVSAWVKLAAYPPLFGIYTVVGNREVSDALARGWFLFITPTGLASFSFNNSPAYTADVSQPVPLNTWTLISASRAPNPGNPDTMTIFVNGQIAFQAAVADTAPGTSRVFVGAGTRDTGGGNLPHNVWGFQGLLDEVYAVKGAGSGIKVAFTPPAVPYNRHNRLPPFA